MELTYEINQKIWSDIQDLFPDELVHLGGDEVISSCWDKRPSIKQWMSENGIANYVELQSYYRTRQKEDLRAGRSPVFWSNEQVS
jgi:hexosaminidase